MDVYEVCRKLHRLGKELRCSNLYKTAPYPLLMFPVEQDAVYTPVSFHEGFSDEAKHSLRVYSAVFREMDIRAAIFQAETMQVRSDRFSAYFNLKPGLDLDEYTRQYSEIMVGYENSVANLPRQLWDDALATFVLGKALRSLAIMDTFTRGVSGEVVWGEHQETFDGNVNFIPQWWDETIN